MNPNKIKYSELPNLSRNPFGYKTGGWKEYDSVGDLLKIQKQLEHRIGQKFLEDCSRVSTKSVITARILALSIYGELPCPEEIPVPKDEDSLACLYCVFNYLYSTYPKEVLEKEMRYLIERLKVELTYQELTKLKIELEEDIPLESEAVILEQIKTLEEKGGLNE